jgi:hypothetical protein
MRLSTPSPLLRLITRCSLAAAAFTTLTGCHAHYVAMNIHNATGHPITLLEVDYPSASFGANALADGADFNYRFKILGDGPTKLLWTDAAQQSHTVSGPDLHEGQEGTLTATITPTTATATAIWTTHLKP